MPEEEPPANFTGMAKAHANAIGERSGARQPDGSPLPRRNAKALGAAQEAARPALEKWIRKCAADQGDATALHTLRRKTELFYDSTTAYRTIADVIDCAKQVFENSEADASVASSLAIFALLTLDIAIFEAIQRSDTQQALDKADKALAAVTTIEKDHGSRSEALALELDVLRTYYDGLALATRTMNDHDESTAAGRLPIPDQLSRVAATLDRAVDELLEEPNHDRIEGRPLDEIHELATMFASRLKPWAATFEGMAEEVARSHDVLLVDTLQIFYCYPFALQLGANRQASLVGALERAARAQLVFSHSGKAGGSADDTILGNLVSKLKTELVVDDGVEVDPLTQSEIWGGAGDVSYDGALIRLASFVIDAPGGPETLTPTLKLSLLGNHCLVIHRELNRPTLPQLYAALRAGGDFVPQSGRSCPKDANGAPKHQDGAQKWQSLHVFADDVITAVSESLSEHDPGGGTAERKDRRPRRDDVHVIALLSTEQEQAQTPNRDQFLRWLAGAYGGSILMANTNRVASTLNEWVRLPTRDDAVIEAPQFGYRGDWMLATSDMTLLFDTGTPTWRAEALVEAAQFAASCSAQLLLWGQELLIRKEPGPEDVQRLRRTHLACERFIASISSKALCWSRAHRELLDVLLTTTGASALARDLGRQLSAVQVLLDDDLRDRREKERDSRNRADQNRNRLLAVIAVFGVFNLSTFSQLINQSHNRPPYWAEVVVQLVVAVVTVAALLAVQGWRRARRRAHETASSQARTPNPRGADSEATSS